MADNEIMIVAGVGFRRAASAEDIEQVIRMALKAIEMPGYRLAVVATETGKANASAFLKAARQLEVTVKGCSLEEMRSVTDRILTHSQRVSDAKGVLAIAEAAALVVAGANGRLLAARIATPQATCAIAMGDG